MQSTEPLDTLAYQSMEEYVISSVTESDDHEEDEDPIVPTLTS